MDKAHGWDRLSIIMIKTCGDAITFPLKLIFKSNVVLPIFSKVFERLVFNTLFNFFLQNKLFTPCQSGFIPGDSCVSQLLSITHEIYKSFDCHPPTDMRGTFLSVSLKHFIKFDLKVWFWFGIENLD